MELLAYKVRIDALNKGGFMVTVPKLQGCITWAETYDQAVVKALEAIRGFIEAMAKAGQPIPVESNHKRRTRVTMVVPAPVAA